MDRKSEEGIRCLRDQQTGRFLLDAKALQAILDISEYRAHRQVHRAIADAVQGFLAAVTVQHIGPRKKVA